MALVSPGPDLVLTLRNAVNFGMKSGILSSLGFGSGILFHSIIAIIAIKGLGQIPQDWLPFLGLPGSLYLIYLGLKSWPSSTAPIDNPLLDQCPHENAYLQGLMTNLFNPKASLFTIGLITTQVRPETDNTTLIALISGIVLLTIMWFSMVSLTLSQEKIRTFYFEQSRKINYLFAIFFIGFGLILIKDLLDSLLGNLSSAY
jgi:threonine/homoserine/homoserine lactone efflux protein